ncbi:MAG TPA: hypothetical protein VL738_33565 [Dactylosporangium sp.]|nr:hypothetical protein [Dactylosporangium sp.]
MLDYHEQRTPHYDAVHERPERRAHRARLGELIPAEFPGRHDFWLLTFRTRENDLT